MANNNPTEESEQKKKPVNLTTRQMELFSIYRENLPITIETVKQSNEIINQCVKQDVIIGRPHDHIISASLLLAAKQTNTPILAEEIAELTIHNEEQVNTLKIQQTARVINRELEVEITPITGEAFLDRFINELDIDEQYADISKDLLNTAKDGEINADPRPSILAASVLDATRRLTDMDTKQQEITQVSCSSPEQLRKYSRPLANT